MPRTVSPQRGRESDRGVGASPGGASPKTRLRIIGKELPDIESDEQFQASWKITKVKEEALLFEFNTILATAGLLRPEHDKYYIRRFLRARQHDLAKAKEMYANHVRWRKENGVDTIMKDFQFHERDAFLSLYPQGYHKTDKLGRPIYIQHLGAINIKKLNEITNEERMLKFHIQEYERCMHYIMPACSKLAGHHIEQTFAIIDVTGVGLSHFSGQVKNLLSKITSVDQNNYPEMMGKTLIINAPGMFKMVWNMVKRFLDARTLAKIDLMGSNYQSTLLKYISEENLPEYLGGSSKATLLDDAGPWQDDDMIEEIDAEWRAAMAEENIRDVEADASSLAGAPRMSGETSTTELPPESLPKVSSPKRKLSIRGFKRQVSATGVPNGVAKEEPDGDFSDALELQSRSMSFGSEDNAAYYSPRSESSFTAFSDRSQTLHDESTSHPYLESLDTAKAQGGGYSKQMALAARIRRLEEAVPGLREKLAPHLDLKRLERGSFTRAGGHNVLGRVEALEDAVEVLLTAQEQKLQAASASPSKDPKVHCGCCTIM